MNVSLRQRTAWRSRAVPAALLGLLAGLVLLVSSCGGRDEPAPVDFPAPPAPVPFDASVFRYVSGGDRLVFPTGAPAPAPTLRPTLDLRPAARPPTPAPSPTPGFVREPVSFWAGRDVDPVALSCRDRYREMLIAHDGRVPFGPEVAQRLSEELVSNRPDCLEEGWSPEFGLERVCVRNTVGGVRIRPGLIYSSGVWSGAQAVGTGRDRGGNILVHFRKLPLRDTRGCWYYLAGGRSWSWFAAGSGGGVDPSVFPECDALLRARLLDGLFPGLGALDVAREMDEVRALRGEGCPMGLWDLYPSSSGYDFCGVNAPTGLAPDGSLVLNWQPDHPASGGALCWVWRPGGEGWREYYPHEEAGIEIPVDNPSG